MNKGLSNEVQKLLMKEAKARRQALAVNMELLPVCNMKCRMCYIRTDMEQVNARGGLKSVEEWLAFAQELKRSEVLFLLLTGGEVFLYPRFKELYIALYKMGFVITINTNATLIDETAIEWLRAYPPMCVSISLYGASDETYEALCGQKGMFTRVNRAAHLLNANGIRIEFKTIYTPANIGDLEKCWQYMGCGTLHYETTTYAFPQVRRAMQGEPYRFQPEEAAKELFHIERVLSKDEREYRANTLKHLQKYESTRHDKGADLYGFTCGAANNSCWITWQGHMTPCAMLEEPHTLPFEQGFAEAWTQLKARCDAIRMSPACSHCDKRAVCSVCPAACFAETGSFEKPSPFHCAMTTTTLDEMRRLAREWAQEEVDNSTEEQT